MLIKNLQKTLLYYDRFDWIEKITSESIIADPFCPFKHVYRFKEIEVFSTAYRYIPDATKHKQHRILVSFYEENVTDDTELWYIPYICYHFARCGLTNRRDSLLRIQYLNILGNYLTHEPESYVEAQQVFGEISKLVEENKLIEDVGPFELSEWHLQLAFCLSGRSITNSDFLDECLTEIYAAFEYLKYSWPETNTDWLQTLFLQGLKWFMTNLDIFTGSSRKALKTNRGTKFSKRNFFKNKSSERMMKLEPSLQLITSIQFHTDALLRDQIGYGLLLCNIQAQMKKTKSFEQSRLKILGSIALKAWFAGYHKIAVKLMSMLPDIFDGQELDGQSYSIKTKFLVSTGQWEIAEAWAKRGIEVCQKYSKTI
jgi:hypothetical protein